MHTWEGKDHPGNGDIKQIVDFSKMEPYVIGSDEGSGVTFHIPKRFAFPPDRAMDGRLSKSKNDPLVRKAVTLMRMDPTDPNMDIDAVLIMEDLKLRRGSRVLSVGPGNVITHIVYAAMKGAIIDVNQPRYYAGPLGLSQDHQQYFLEALRGIDDEKIEQNIHPFAFPRPIQKAGIPTSSYDTVVLLKVFDGVPAEEQRKIAREVLRITKDRGTVLLSTVNQRDLPIVTELLKKIGEKWPQGRITIKQTAQMGTTIALKISKTPGSDRAQAKVEGKIEIINPPNDLGSAGIHLRPSTNLSIFFKRLHENYPDGIDIKIQSLANHEIITETGVTGWLSGDLHDRSSVRVTLQSTRYSQATLEKLFSLIRSMLQDKTYLEGASNWETSRQLHEIMTAPDAATTAPDRAMSASPEKPEVSSGHWPDEERGTRFIPGDRLSDEAMNAQVASQIELLANGKYQDSFRAGSAHHRLLSSKSLISANRIIIGHAGQVVAEEGSIYCNYIFIYDVKDMSSKKAAVIHAENSDAGIVEEDIKRSLEALGINVSDKEYIRENVFVMAARPNHRHSGAIENQYYQMSQAMGINVLNSDVDDKWQSNLVRVLVDEGLIASVSVENDRILHAVDMMEFIQQKMNSLRSSSDEAMVATSSTPGVGKVKVRLDSHSRLTIPKTLWQKQYNSQTFILTPRMDQSGAIIVRTERELIRRLRLMLGKMPDTRNSLTNPYKTQLDRMIARISAKVHLTPEGDLTIPRPMRELMLNKWRFWPSLPKEFYIVDQNTHFELWPVELWEGWGGSATTRGEPKVSDRAKDLIRRVKKDVDDFRAVNEVPGTSFGNSVATLPQMMEDLAVRLGWTGSGAASVAGAVPRRILDIGSGEGLAAVWFAALSGWEVTSIEKSPDLVEFASELKHYLSQRWDLSRLTFLEADAEDKKKVSFRDYDLVYFFFTAVQGDSERFARTLVDRLEKELKPGAVFVSPLFGDYGSVRDRVLAGIGGPSSRLSYRIETFGAVPAVVITADRAMAGNDAAEETNEQNRAPARNNIYEAGTLEVDFQEVASWSKMVYRQRTWIQGEMLEPIAKKVDRWIVENVYHVFDDVSSLVSLYDNSGFYFNIRRTWFHALDNAVDGYFQKFENDPSPPPLKLRFWVSTDEDEIIIGLENNGILLSQAETSEDKKRARAQGKMRIGGQHLGLEMIETELREDVSRDATLSLEDLKDGGGVLSKMTLPKRSFVKRWGLYQGSEQDRWLLSDEKVVKRAKDGVLLINIARNIRDQEGWSHDWAKELSVMGEEKDAAQADVNASENAESREALVRAWLKRRDLKWPELQLAQDMLPIDQLNAYVDHVGRWFYILGALPSVVYLTIEHFNLEVADPGTGTVMEKQISWQEKTSWGLWFIHLNGSIRQALGASIEELSHYVGEYLQESDHVKKNVILEEIAGETQGMRNSFERLGELRQVILGMAKIIKDGRVQKDWPEGAGATKGLERSSLANWFAFQMFSNGPQTEENRVILLTAAAEIEKVLPEYEKSFFDVEQWIESKVGHEPGWQEALLKAEQIAAEANRQKEANDTESRRRKALEVLAGTRVGTVDGAQDQAVAGAATGQDWTKEEIEFGNGKRISEVELRRVLDEGSFAVISAGPNLSERKDMEKIQGELAGRADQMRAALETIENIRIYAVTGRDDMPQEEKGFLVVMHEAADETVFRKATISIAKDFNQDSVSFSFRGNNEIAFTDGHSLKGEGYQWVGENADFYTSIRLAEGNTVRFALNIFDLAMFGPDVAQADSNASENVESREARARLWLERYELKWPELQLAQDMLPIDQLNAYVDHVGRWFYILGALPSVVYLTIERFNLEVLDPKTGKVMKKTISWQEKTSWGLWFIHLNGNIQMSLDGSIGYLFFYVGKYLQESDHGRKNDILEEIAGATQRMRNLFERAGALRQEILDMARIIQENRVKKDWPEGAGVTKGLERSSLTNWFAFQMFSNGPDTEENRVILLTVAAEIEKVGSQYEKAFFDVEQWIESKVGHEPGWQEALLKAERIEAEANRQKEANDTESKRRKALEVLAGTRVGTVDGADTPDVAGDAVSVEESAENRKVFLDGIAEIKAKNQGRLFVFSDKDETFTETHRILLKDNGDRIIDLILTGGTFSVVTGAEYERVEAEFVKPLMQYLDERQLPVSLLNRVPLITDNGNIFWLFDEKAGRYVVERSYRMADDIGDDGMDIVRDTLQRTVSRFGLDDLPDQDVYNTTIIPKIIETQAGINLSVLGDVKHKALRDEFDPDQKRRQEMAYYIQLVLEERLGKERFSKIRISISGTSTINIMGRDESKGRGVERAIAYFGASKDGVVYFGDAFLPGENDHSITRVGVPFIVNVGLPVKDVASGSRLINAAAQGPKGFGAYIKMILDEKGEKGEKGTVPNEGQRSISTDRAEAVITDINTPGLLVTGKAINSLASDKKRREIITFILARGILPYNKIPVPLRQGSLWGHLNPDYISFTMVPGRSGYNGTASAIQHHAPSIKNADTDDYRYHLGLILDPDYVRTRLDDFLAVGEAFKEGGDLHEEYIDESGAILSGLSYKRSQDVRTELSVWPTLDEIWTAEVVPPEAIAGIIVHDAFASEVRDIVQTTIPGRSIRIFNPKGELLFDIQGASVSEAVDRAMKANYIAPGTAQGFPGLPVAAPVPTVIPQILLADKDAWLARAGNERTRQIRQSILDKITHITFAQFQDELTKVANIFNKTIGKKPYVVLWDSAPGSSRRWVYEQVKGRLTQKPADGIYFDPADKSRGTKDKILEAVDRGIDTFVIFDDGMYSGHQVVNTLKAMKSMLPGRKINVIVAVPYYTSGSQTVLGMLKTYMRKGADITVTPIHTYHIKTVGELLEPNDYSYLYHNRDNMNKADTEDLRVGPATEIWVLTYFDFKVPDMLSFMKPLLGLFTPRIEELMPPYKVKGTPYNIAEEKDQAAKTSTSPGGIDLTRERMDVELQSEGQGVQFTFDPAMIQQLQNASGLTPVIIDIQPMTITLPMFLGLDDVASSEMLSMNNRRWSPDRYTVVERARELEIEVC